MRIGKRDEDTVERESFSAFLAGNRKRLVVEAIALYRGTRQPARGSGLSWHRNADIEHLQRGDAGRRRDPHLATQFS